ncbi:transporter [Thiothrix nivea]|uniref:transporter n=1 Tax=Thiothrix nivea TaxID=1031 RepID=UPI00145E8B09|nr:transporter [Thiothrix nivea]
MLLPFIAATFTDALADLPLTVDDLLSDEGKLRIEFSTTYSNSERKGVEALESITVQTGPTSFVRIPTALGENSSNVDAMVASAGLRYGIDKSNEVYGRASLLGFQQRSLSSTGTATEDTDGRFADAWIGINHQLNGNADQPGLLGFAEVQVAERQADGDTAYGESMVIGATAYQAYDPIVLSMTGAFQLNGKREVADSRIRPGNSLILSPSVAFAVNDKVTLSGGLNWRATQASRKDGQKGGIATTRTALDLGVAYALNEGDTLDVNVRPQVSGDNNVQVTMGWVRNFANEPKQQGKEGGKKGE